MIVPFSSMFEGIHPAVELEDMKRAEDCFLAFMSKNIVQCLCNWTNERAGKYLVENGTQKVYDIIWKDVTVPEMYTFLALHLYMGLIHYPTIHDYWSHDFLFRGPNIFCAEVMSRNRFCAILKFLRFSDPRAFIPGKPITRLGMFFAYVKENCKNLVDPGEIIAVDECLVLYKGRIHFKQFIKTKRSRFGMKMFCACPSSPDLRGYTYNFVMYFGKDTFNVDHIPGSHVLSMSERIVVFLLQDLLEQGREIIIDNWYTSLRLAEFLLTKNTYVTGTIRVNRGVPKELTETHLETFQTCFIRKGDVLIARYKDKRDVHLLTTKHKAGYIEKNRFQPSISRNVPILKPNIIEHYNLNMGGVDAIDQDIEPYDCTRKSYTWFKKIGFHIIQRMVLNSKVLYTNAGGKEKTVLGFTKILIDRLLAKYSPGYKKIKENYKERCAPRRVSSGDHPAKNRHIFGCNVKETGHRRKRGKCRVCYQTAKKKSYTSNLCGQCPNGPIYLCSKAHFDIFHGYD